MSQRSTSALVLTCLVVLAGCSAPVVTPSPTAETAPPTETTPSTPTGTPSTTSQSTVTETAPTTPPSTPDSRVTVYGDLRVNATAIWERVRSLLGGEYDQPVVTVRNQALDPQAGPFATHLGLDEGVATFNTGRVRASYSQRTGRVRLSPRNGSAEAVARILAHEYVHAVQFRFGPGNDSGFVGEIAERDGLSIQRALLEGSAVYVEDAYTRRFLGFSAIERRCEEYEQGTPYERYAGQAYCFGGRYFAAQLDSPGDLLSPTATLPNTTEQVLHPETTDEPTNLTVVDETPSNWYTPASFDRRGELFVRTVLGVELSEKRASMAATGWGNDRLVQITGQTEGYVWVLRWDTTADADQFETAFADYLDARGARIVDGWRVDGEQYRLTAVDNRTVAVVTGNETFVDTVTVEEGNGTLTVSTD